MCLCAENPLPVVDLSIVSVSQTTLNKTSEEALGKHGGVPKQIAFVKVVRTRKFYPIVIGWEIETGV